LILIELFAERGYYLTFEYTTFADDQTNERIKK